MNIEMLKRWRWAILVGALLLLGLAFAFWPEAEPVDIGKVTKGEMSVGVTDDGVTRAEEYYVVSAPVTGYLSRIELEAGDKVSRGALITRMSGTPATPLDSRSREELRNALAAARAAQSSAVSSAAQAQRDLQRAEELAKRGFLPRAQLEEARTRVATGEAAAQQARAEVRRTQALLTQPSGPAPGAPVPVRAPASGSVMSVINESEGVIPQGTELVTIGDPHQIEVVVDLLSREAVRVKPGDRVEITEWGGPKPLAAHVKRIEPFGKLKISALGIEEQRVNVIIGFDQQAAQQAARLGHGYQIDATIVLWSRKDALRVPIGALFRGGDGGWRVYVDDGGRAEERAVNIGHINDEYGEVLKGLAEGDTVVVNPGNALEDGDRISPR
ncbi:MAG: efflux RND transporter periplasmic adaptor subunit [Novosphingobium sp.]